MIELIVYPKSDNIKLINNSPYCSKTEIFLVLAGLDFKIIEFNADPAKFPKKKLPVIKDGNQQIEDSYFIEKYLTHKYKIKLNDHLTDFEKSQGFAFSKMLEDFFYWTVLHERWFVDSNWQKLRAKYFDNIPKLIRGLISNMIRKNMKKNAIGQGMSRHSDAEIYELGFKCLKALSDFLGAKNYLLGDKISSFDSTVYAFVASVLHSELGPELKKEAMKYENLINYDNRLFNHINLAK